MRFPSLMIVNWLMPSAFAIIKFMTTKYPKGTTTVAFVDVTDMMFIQQIYNVIRWCFKAGHLAPNIGKLVNDLLALPGKTIHFSLHLMGSGLGHIIGDTIH